MSTTSDIGWVAYEWLSIARDCEAQADRMEKFAAGLRDRAAYCRAKAKDVEPPTRPDPARTFP